MENVAKKEIKPYQHVIKAVGCSLLFTVVLLFIFSCILTYTDVNESIITPVIIIITAISILLGSSLGNAKIKKNGVLNGAIIGAMYFGIIYIISSLLNWKYSLTKEAIIFIVIGVICGILGGILGVNKK